MWFLIYLTLTEQLKLLVLISSLECHVQDEWHPQYHGAKKLNRNFKIKKNVKIPM